MYLRVFIIICGLLAVVGCNGVTEFTGCRSDGECTEGQACRGGACVAKSTVDKTCDGVDDDQDGKIDEDAPTNVAATRLQGVCHVARLVCNNGIWSEPDYLAIEGYNDEDVSCDGLDNDCDGVADESYLETRTECGTGACAETGLARCIQGRVVDTCIAGAAAEADTSCDGVDDDCDGQVDESYAGVSIQCGSGVCTSMGMTNCVEGVVQDDCQAGQRTAADDLTCDGLDDDCDGEVDEDYAPVASACGTGACAGTGTTRCEGGQVVEICLVGERLSTEDFTCDGVDDDCDGQTDEDYADSPTTCGVGLCLNQGSVVCREGAPIDTCQPRPQGSESCGELAEERGDCCNGVDDDCDGLTDEDLGCTYCPQGHDDVPCNGCDLEGGVSVPDGWVCIPSGRFLMGSLDEDWDCVHENHVPGAGCGAVPQREVTITYPYLIQATEMTQESWSQMVPGMNNPSFAQECPTCPVESVPSRTWMEFTNIFAANHGLSPCYGDVPRIDSPGRTIIGWNDRDCTGYRLPTEAEWEYAARGGVLAPELWYRSEDHVFEMAQIAWTTSNARVRYRVFERSCLMPAVADGFCDVTHPVGGLLPNPWGLYDVIGNVGELVFDHSIGLSPDAPSVDPALGFGPAHFSAGRLVRGGSVWTNFLWYDLALAQRVVFCDTCWSDDTRAAIGARLVRALAPSAEAPAD